MTLTGYVCLLSLALALGMGGGQGPSAAAVAAVASVDAILRDAPIAPPLWLDPAPPERLAPNIWMQEPLRASLMQAWRRSASFRAQVRAIAAHRAVYVTIALDDALARDRSCRAQCELRRYSSGLLMARISLPGVADLVELVAHELEHVRERLEGVDHRLLARLPGRGVMRQADGRFESLRAIEMGRRVRDEVLFGGRELTQARPRGPERGTVAPVLASTRTMPLTSAVRSRRP